MNDTQLCECGCGASVSPGRRFRKGHHLRLAEYRQRARGARTKKGRQAQRKMLAGMLKRDEHHFLVQTASKPVRWDDEWAFVDHDALRDTESVLETIGRYGCVEVSYAPAHEAEDPYVALDVAVEVILEARHVKRLRQQFEQAGFEDLTDEEVKYLWQNGYECAEDLVA